MIISARKSAPGLKMIDEVNFLNPQKGHLHNGIPVYLQKGGSQEIVKVEFVFKSGSYHQQKPLQSWATANLLKSGTKFKSSEEINQLWDFYGASLQVDAQKDITSVGFVALSKHLVPALDLIFEMIVLSEFPEDELITFLKNRKQKFLVDNRKVQYLARMHFAELIYGPNHPYGKRLQESDFEELTREDLIKFHQNYYLPGNCICLIAGNYPKTIINTLDKSLKKFAWESREINQLPERIPEITQKPKHLLPRPNTLQSALRIGKPVITREHPDYHMLSVTNALLGGYFGSRLMKSIRQEKGYTYGINSALVNLLRGAYFFIASQVGRDVKNQAVEEIYNEIKAIRKQPAGDAEINMLRNYLSGSFLRSFDGPFMQSERFKEILLFGQDYAWFHQYLETLKSFQPEDIQKTAEKYLHEESMVELIVG